MKLSTREDIRAPRDYVWDRLADFDALEGMVTARGVNLTRLEDGGPDGRGRRWRAEFSWKERAMATEARVSKVDPGAGYCLESETAGVTCFGVLDLHAVDEERTRLHVSLDFRPTTLSSRLLLQSLKLAKPRLSRKLDERVAKLALDIQRGYAP